MELLADQSNYPIYIHDLDGSDVLAIMCAALRKLQGWSEPAWTTEMCRFFKQPPPESEHLTFLRRLLSSPPHPSTPADEAALSITIPPPPQRVSWLWPLGRPTGKTKPRLAVDEGEPDPPPNSLAASTASDLAPRKPDLNASAMRRALTATPHHLAQDLLDGPHSFGPSSVLRSRSATPNHARWASAAPSAVATPVGSAPGSSHSGSRPASEAGEESEGTEAGAEEENEREIDGDQGDDYEEEEEGDEEGDEEEEEDEDDVEPLSRTVEALDLF